MNPAPACNLNAMSAHSGGSLPRIVFSGFQCLNNSNRAGGLMQNHAMWGNECFGDKISAYCGRASAKLNNQNSWGCNMLYKLFWSDATKSAGHFRADSPIEPGTPSSEAFCTEQHTVGAIAAADVEHDAVPPEEQLKHSPVSFDEKSTCDRTLRLACGSCSLPHPNKEETGGEDAHFICVDEQAIGVADGVGGWAVHGIDAGEYARELMSNAVSAIKEEPKGLIDPIRVLEKAHLRTKKVGSSTACIIALMDQGIHAVNLGDSGFIIVREGSTVFQSPPQQHDFNFPYQLDAAGGGDLPRDAQVFTVPVTPGDVIIAGTDGLFDNLYASEVADVVMHAVKDELGPQDTARKLASLARQRAVDSKWKSPFSAAAEEAGYYYCGGKLDDISVVVCYVTASLTS